MQYKVGDHVRIKSLDWYNKNKDNYGAIYAGNGFCFWKNMSRHCGEIMKITIVKVDPEDSNKGYYFMENCEERWTDGMIECLVEEKTLIERFDDNGLPFNEWLSHRGAFHIPDGYIFKDENGNVINAHKIVLEKKKKEYPKTYEECLKVLNIEGGRLCFNNSGITQYERDLYIMMNNLSKLLICRDAYWKMAGDDMGLGKSWEPDCNSGYFIPAIIYRSGSIQKVEVQYRNAILAFPTKEMRDAFKENFDPDIEICKEFL